MAFHTGWMGGMMWWGILFWIVIIGLVIWVVKSLINSQERRSNNHIDDAEAILHRRYANGEISRDQFEQMKNDLRR